jgi:hypothetical protein
MRKYRIIEEKYEHVSHFYPQYKDEDVAYYVLGHDGNGKDIKSEYQYFSSWNEKGIMKRDVYISISEARKRIEMDIKQRTSEELKETIIHEY